MLLLVKPGKNKIVHGFCKSSQNGEFRVINVVLELKHVFISSNDMGREQIPEETCFGEEVTSIIVTVSVKRSDTTRMTKSRKICRLRGT